MTNRDSIIESFILITFRNIPWEDLAIICATTMAPQLPGRCYFYTLQGVPLPLRKTIPLPPARPTTPVPFVLVMGRERFTRGVTS